MNRHPDGTAERFACCVASDDASWHATELADLWNGLGEEAAWRVAEEHDLVSIATLALQQHGGISLPARWVERTASVRSRLQRYMAAIDNAAEALQRRGIRLVALKNCGIARGIYPDLAGCPMGDVDVLVDPARFREAHECLLSLGYRLASRSPLGEKNLAEAELSGGTEYTLPLDDGTTLWFELQWRPVGGRWIRAEQEPSAAELLARAVAIPGSAAHLLAPNDNLLQVCLHTAKHSYVRAPGFRLHTDVDRIVRRLEIDWSRFVETVGRLGLRTAVYFSLMLPAELLRTPVPDWVLANLTPAAARRRYIERSLHRVGLFHPSAPKWGRLGYVLFNAAMYDSVQELAQAIMPDFATMQKRHGVRSRWSLPWYHARRLAALLLKRAKT